MADFDSLVDDKAAQQPVAQQQVQPQMQVQTLPSFDELQDDTEKYETPTELAKSFGHGVLKGTVTGPGAVALEKAFGRRPEDILAEEKINPGVVGLGEAAGLGAGLLTGTGEAAAMTKAGQLAAKAVPVISEGMAGVDAARLALKAAQTTGKGVEEASLALKAAEAATPLRFRVGEEAVKQAAEMAVLQSGDETAKMMLNDPETSAESAIANVGLSAALGAGTGALITGVVSPLWKATVGPQVEKGLTGLKDHLNGGVALLPEELKLAQNDLGIEIAPEIRSAMSGNPIAQDHFNILKEARNKEVLSGIEKLNSDISNSVSRSLGILPEDVANYSENVAGHDLAETFKKEYMQKYGPIADALEKRNEIASKIAVSDESRLSHYGKLLEEGMNKVGTDSPYYKVYNDYGQRLLAKDTIGGIDALKTEINGEIDKAVRANDTNMLQALKDVRNSMADLQEQQIESQVYNITGKQGLKTAEEIIAERQAANQSYRDFAKMSNDLTDHLGVGRFTGAKGLTTKLAEKISPEQLLNKFSVKGNADFIPFLEKNFPEVFNKVRENELKRLIKPAVLSAKGEEPLNIKKLADIIEKGMAGQKEYIQSILPQEAVAKVQSANRLLDAVPNLKSSGTAGHLAKLMKDIPRSAMAAVAMLTGHNPLFGGIMGELAQKLGRDAPDAIRLAHLKFLGSDQPIKAEGFKAMVDFMHNTYKGETMLAKSAKAVLKPGAQVIADSAAPNKADREKLDKTITKIQADPNQFMQLQQNQHLGHYLPNQQQAVTQTATRALQYLQQLKPKDHTFGPLDKPVPPQPSEIARYNRALDIAINPSIVLEHVKNGTLMPSDIADLNGMFPSLYKNMCTKLTNEVVGHHADEEPIPYKTRIGISMFLGQPMDASMTPESIMAAQPIPKAPPQPPQGAQGPNGQGKSMKSLGKSNKTYMTPSQSSETHRANKD
jgi:hypothetical protein